jgi:hypothetical protein
MVFGTAAILAKRSRQGFKFTRVFGSVTCFFTVSCHLFDTSAGYMPRALTEMVADHPDNTARGGRSTGMLAPADEIYLEECLI